MMVRFLHLSDTHLGNRQYMMPERELDFYESFREAISIGLEENVDFFVHSGDLFDFWNPSNQALKEFRDSMITLREKNKPVFMIMGDHDRPKRKDYPAAQLFDFLGIRVLGKDSFEHTVQRFGSEDIFIGGISNLKGFSKPLLISEYQKAGSIARDTRNSVLISHQGVTNFGFPDEACEVTREMVPGNYSYLAFGHFHNFSKAKIGDSLFSYPGSTDINSTNEIDSFLKTGKGVNLVDIEKGEATMQRLPLKSTRMQAKISTDPDRYAQEIDNFLSQYSDRIGSKKPLVTIEIRGDSDKPAIRRYLENYSEKIIFRPPIFITAAVEKESRPNLNSIMDYLRNYFKDGNLADLANNIYQMTQGEVGESIYQDIKGKMGLETPK